MKVLQFIVCDDIRHEIGNKHTLVGIYSENITFAVQQDKRGEWPKTIKLAFYVLLEVSDQLPASIEIKMTGPQGALTIGKTALDTQKIQGHKRLRLAIVNNSVRFTHEGDYCFSVTLYDSKDSEMDTEIPDYKFHVSEQPPA